MVIWGFFLYGGIAARGQIYMGAPIGVVEITFASEIVTPVKVLPLFSAPGVGGCVYLLEFYTSTNPPTTSTVLPEYRKADVRLWVKVLYKRLQSLATPIEC